MATGGLLGQFGTNASTGGKAMLGQYEDFFGTNQKKYKEDQQKIDTLNQQRIDQSKGVADQMKESDSAYMSARERSAKTHLENNQTYGNQYVKKADQLAAQAEDQAKNAQRTYSNDIQPVQKGLMDDAYRNSQSAMSLEDAMNPNNKVSKGVRDLYDQQGQKIRQQGLTDAGVLAAMGAQATAGQLGGMPVFTGSNLANLSAQNQRQSSEAFSAAQKRMMDLQEQGLGKGIEQSNAMYDRGQEARGMASDLSGRYQQGYNQNDEIQRGYRDEQQGYAADRMGVLLGMSGQEYDINNNLSDISHGLSQGQMNRDLGILGDDYSSQIGSIQNMSNIRSNIGSERRRLMLDPAANLFTGMGGGKNSSSAQPIGGQQGGMQPDQGQPAYQNRGVSGGMNYGYGSYNQMGPPTEEEYRYRGQGGNYSGRGY